LREEVLGAMFRGFETWRKQGGALHQEKKGAIEKKTKLKYILYHQPGHGRGGLPEERTHSGKTRRRFHKGLGKVYGTFRTRRGKRTS